MDSQVEALAALAAMKAWQGAAVYGVGKWDAGAASFDRKIGKRLIAQGLVEVVRRDQYGEAARIELNLRALDKLAGRA